MLCANRRKFGADMRQGKAAGDGPAIPFGDCVCGTVGFFLSLMVTSGVATLLNRRKKRPQVQQNKLWRFRGVLGNFLLQHYFTAVYSFY